MRKRSRSLSPTPCDHARPLKRSSALALAIGDGAREPPPSFAPQQPTNFPSPAQMQTLSTFLLVPPPAQSAYMSVADADGGIQDEWVTLTRNLTLLSARGPTEDGISVSNGSREEIMMNLDEPPHPSTLVCPHVQQHGVQGSPEVHIGHKAPQLLNPHTDASTLGLPSSRITPPVAIAFLRAPSPPIMPTPPLCTTPLPSHSPFSAARMGTPPLALLEPQLSQQPLPGPTRRPRFTMGPRPDCDKCRLAVPGHYAHFD